MIEDKAMPRLIKSWLFDDALPLWGANGIDRIHDGYVERLDLSGRPQDPGFKRVRVTGRQIYVFSQAHILGWEPGFDRAKHGYDFLISKAWMGNGKGWARTLRTDGSILDATADLYDNAFALFALGWYYRISKDETALEYALATLDFLDAHMRHPLGGFLHEYPASGWRQQNPHMHLLEAALACFESTQHPRFADLAHELVDLFRKRIFDWSTGTLPEFFNDDLSKAAAPDGRITEPGHQFEWVWILWSANRLLGIDVEDIAQVLLSTANRYGVCAASGATFNQVRDDGILLDGGSRTWPNTERIKGAIAASELWGSDPQPAMAEAVELLFSKHLRVDPAGNWVDAFDSKWQPTVEFVPASTLYHLVLAFAEILRHFKD